MMRVINQYITIFIMACVFALTACDDAPQETMSHVVTVDGAYAYATTPVQKNGAVFFTLKNETAHNDSLLGAQSAAANMVQIHAMDMKNDIMNMHQIERINIPKGGAATLSPQGNHIMLMGLNAPLRAGESVSVTLDFERSADITINVPIRAPYAPAP